MDTHTFRLRATTIMTAACIALLALAVSSCHKDEPSPVPSHSSTAILVYAVASNNLSSSFYADRDEMLEGLASADLDEVAFMVYSVTPDLMGTQPPTLSRAVRNGDGNVELVEIKRYGHDTYSTDPRRISEVISDFKSLAPAETYGVFFWSHATSWVPSGSDHVVNPTPYAASSAGLHGEGIADAPELQWFGQDKYNGKSDYCDIIEMADAIPDGAFDFIWWDCCYMSSIEVIYQFRNKAKRFVAYPTEVLAEGAPYDIILPFVAKANPNLVAAAELMSDYFRSGDKVFTIAVINPDAIEDVADLARAAVPGTRLIQPRLIKYSRGSYRFYDFGQYTSSWGESLGENWDSRAFSDAMDRLIVYKAASDRLFDGKPLPEDYYSGISTHYVNLDFDPTWDDPDPQDLYYTKLDWFKRVFASAP